MFQHECYFPIASGQLPYLLGLPPTYHDDPDQHWPLIFFLHGRGERGANFELLKSYGIPKVVDELDDFPFITVAPQCPLASDWSDHRQTLLDLLDHVLATYAVDATQVYLTGLSMGARGSWQLAVENPERFTALALICGRIPDMPDFFERLPALRTKPIWVFHGAQDPIVPISNSERIVAALRQMDNPVRYTIYPEADHDSWTETYENPALYEWLLHVGSQ